MKRDYQRSQILNYFELDEEQKNQADDQCDDRAEDCLYVIWKYPDETTEVLPLEMFVRDTGKSLFHGTYGTSYFSAWLIRINRSGDEATLVNATW